MSSQTYDKQLLSRIGGPNTPKRSSLSYTSAGVHDSVQQSQNSLDRQNSALQALVTAERRHGSLDSTSGIRWPTSSAIWAERTAGETSQPSTSRNASIAFDDNGSHRGSYDHSMFVSDEIYMEEGQMSNLYIDDPSPGSPKAGSKRRASSPPREREERASVSSASGLSDIHTRRSVHQLPNRTSPVSRYHPNHPSPSSASSIGPRQGSLGSSLGMASIPSSATSYGSDQASPCLVSPAFDADLRNGSITAAHSAMTSDSIAAHHHQRALSESAPSVRRKISLENVHPNARHNSLSHLQDIYVCECCPKKPRKFDTEDELRYVLVTLHSQRAISD